MMDAKTIRGAVKFALTDQPDLSIPAAVIAKSTQAWADTIDAEILAGIIARGETDRLKRKG